MMKFNCQRNGVGSWGLQDMIKYLRQINVFLARQECFLFLFFCLFCFLEWISFGRNGLAPEREELVVIK